MKSSVVYLNIVFGSIKMKDKHIIKKEKKKKHSVRVLKSPNVSRSRGYYGFSSDFRVRRTKRDSEITPAPKHPQSQKNATVNFLRFCSHVFS